jgi:hypothetical protein
MSTASIGHDPRPSNRTPGEAFMCTMQTSGAHQGFFQCAGGRVGQTAGRIAVVHPLGLVLKAGSWYLVSAAQETIEVLCIDDLRSTRLTYRRFPPLPGFELAPFWKSHAASAGRVKTR